MRLLHKMGKMEWLMAGAIGFLGILCLIGMYPESTPLTAISAKDSINYRSYPVSTVIVVDGNTFDVLSQDKRYLVKLGLETLPEAQRAIIELFHKCQSPKILLIKKENGVWIGDFMLKLNNKQVLLTSWLRQNNLVYK